MYKNYDYIVTGATGFVGNVFTKRLLELGCKVTGFARSEKKVIEVFGENRPNMIYGDITKQEDIARLFELATKNTVVIHTVAKVSIGETPNSVMYDITVNGTKLVVDACLQKKVKKLLHISSTEALPKGTDVTDLESYTPNPDKAKKGYSKTKSQADKIVYDAVKNNGLDASTLMFASVIGPGDYTKGHMSQMMIDYIEGRLPASIKGGYNDFDIRDVADVLPAIIENSKAGENYVFANKPDKINDVLDVISKKLNKKKLKALPVWLAYVGLPFLTLHAKVRKKRPLYTKTALSTLKEDANFNLDKVKREFNYSPRSLEVTVSDQVDFMIEKGFCKI